MSNITCGCGKGHASSYDSLCCFCREKLFSRAVAKGIGVRHRGDGMSVEQVMAIEKKRGNDRVLQIYAVTLDKDSEV